MDKFQKILKELEPNLNLIDSSLKDWNIGYFRRSINRYESDLKLIKEYYGSGDILEIGAIPCHLTLCLKRLNLPVVSIDIKPERARKFIDKFKLNVIKCDVDNEKIPFEDNKFNLVIFNHVFEHLRIDPISTLKEINRILKPGGVLILATPNLYYWKKIVNFNLGRGIVDTYSEVERLELIGHVGHMREYSTKEVKTFLEKTDFDVINVEYKEDMKNDMKVLGRILNAVFTLIPKLRKNQTVISKKKL